MGRRRQRKYEKELRDKQIAQDRLDKKNAKKEHEANKTPEEKAQDSKDAAIGCAIIIAIIVVIFAIVGACSVFGNEDESKPNSAPKSTSPEATATTEASEAESAYPATSETNNPSGTAPEPVDAPLVVGQILQFAHEKAKDIDFVDFGPVIVDGIDHERGVFDQGNWKIISQCEELIRGKLKVGVIKVEEAKDMVDGGFGHMIANNELEPYLSCH